MFWIEDDFHADVIRDGFDTFDSALEELRRIAAIPFGEPPNRPPCTNWKNCVRDYHIVEYGNPEKSTCEMIDRQILEISASELIWFLME